MLLQRGYKYSELYDMTLLELKNSLVEVNKGLAYEIWKYGAVQMAMFSGNAPKTPEEASPELYPPKIVHSIPMPDFLLEKAMKRGVI